jgi:hypothetical protein
MSRVASPAGQEAPQAELDDELFDMVNLPRKDTGVDGTIYISTAQGAHGPRIKWFPGRPGRDVPCLTVTLEDPTRVLNHGLPSALARRAEPALLAWVVRNRADLLRFWNEGLSWTRDEVNSFIDGLEKLS